MSRDKNIDDILLDFEEESSISRDDTTTTSKLKSTTNIYQELITAMINERMSPEILPYEKHLMDTVLTQISNQEQYLLDSHEYGDMNSEAGVVSSDFKLQLMIIETDIERLNYLVRLYLRTRLSKIGQFTIFYINETSAEDEDSKGRLLSVEEMQYMHKYFKLLTSLYNNCFLKKLPHSLTLLDDTSGGQSMIVAPDLDQPVFIKSNSKTPIFLDIGEGDNLELNKDGIYVVRYRLVRKYIELGDIVLI